MGGERVNPTIICPIPVCQMATGRGVGVPGGGREGKVGAVHGISHSIAYNLRTV